MRPPPPHAHSPRQEKYKYAARQKPPHPPHLLQSTNKALLFPSTPSMFRLSYLPLPWLYDLQDSSKLLELTVGRGMRTVQLCVARMHGRQDVPRSPFVQRGSCCVDFLPTFPASQDVFGAGRAHNSLFCLTQWFVRHRETEQQPLYTQYWEGCSQGNGKGEQAMRSLPASDLLCKLRRQGAGDQGYSNNYRPFSAYPKLGIKSDFPHPEEVLIHQGLDGRWTPCHLRQIFAKVFMSRRTFQPPDLE